MQCSNCLIRITLRPLYPPIPPLPRGHGWRRGDISNMCQHPAGMNHSNGQSGLCEGVNGRPFTRPAANQVQGVCEDRTQEQPALQIQVQFSDGTGHLRPRAGAGGTQDMEPNSSHAGLCMHASHTGVPGCKLRGQCATRVAAEQETHPGSTQLDSVCSPLYACSCEQACNNVLQQCTVKGAIWWRASSCSPNTGHPVVHQKHCCTTIHSNPAHRWSNKLNPAAQMSCKSHHKVTPQSHRLKSPLLRGVAVAFWVL